MNIQIEVAPGELLDKLSILEIKLERINDSDKLKNIEYEYNILNRIYRRLINSTDLSQLYEKLKNINNIIWDIEDNIRDCERNKTYSSEFIELARSVYVNNDERARIKKEINMLCNSKIIEEKSYSEY